MIYRKTSLILLFSFCVSSCFTTETGSGRKKNKGAKKEPHGFEVVSFSRSNDDLSGRSIDISGAKSIARKNPKNSDREGLTEVLMTKAIVERDINSLIQVTGRLSQLELQQGVDRKIDEKAKLSLAVAALLQKNWGFFALWLDDVLASKNKKVKALAYNLKGLAQYDDGRVPEAIALWQTALGFDDECESCALNLGFALVATGAYEEAAQAFSAFKDEWIAQLGLVSALKFAGKKSEVSALCKNLTKEQSRHYGVLYNCGIFMNDVGGDKSLTIDWLTKALKVAPKGGDQSWQKEARAILSELAPKPIEKPKA